MSQNILKEMYDNAVHFGHKTQKWNPKMKKYIFTSKNGIHYIDLKKSSECLDKALEQLKFLSANGKRILLVSTKPQATSLILHAAEKTGMPYVVNKWMGGLLTNFSTIKQRTRYYRSLRDQEKSGELSKYTKKEISEIKKDMVKLEAAVGGVKDMDRLPDALFVADVVRDQIAVQEANKLKIPVIAIVDSNADPDGVSFPIPGNDDAIKSLTYLISKVESAILEGKGGKK